MKGAVGIILTVGIGAVSAIGLGTAVDRSVARADPREYSPTFTGWNGLSSFVSLARGVAAVETPLTLELRDLTPNDGLVLIYPQRDLPLVSISSFLRSGGRVAVIDDYGTGEHLLDVYGIRRGDSQPTSPPPLLRNNMQLPLAQPRLQGHPLSEGVSALVANHPRVVAHHALRPVFAFDQSTQAVVLAGVVGEGRLVAVADPSILINNMLEATDNRRFASNLLRYLHAGRGGKLFILGPHAAVNGLAGDQRTAQGLSALTDWIDRLAHARLPPLGLQLIAAALVAILLVMTFGSLPRRSPYDDASMFPPSPRSATGKDPVRWLAQGTDLTGPILLYKAQVDAVLLQTLGLRAPQAVDEILAATRHRGLPDAVGRGLSELLAELDRIERRLRDTPGNRVSRSTFQRVVDSGERLLLQLNKT